MEVAVTTARYRLDATAAGVRAVIPAPRRWLVVVFLSLWLCGWVFGEFSVAPELLSSDSKAPVAFLTFWLLGWTIGGLVVVTTLLWQLFGVESVEVGPMALSYRAEVFGIGRTREFRVADIRRLRAVDFAQGLFMNRRLPVPPLFGRGYGPLAFDYGARTYRIAPSLDEAEARLLVNEIAPRLPKFCRES
ncbi:MAG TPA: hypothetical protein VGV09_09965 [Steroidobacteraceae bacterium]|nr:hypothetical protein [Steroidobacteraceae bacterium]